MGGGGKIDGRVPKSCPGVWRRLQQRDAIEPRQDKELLFVLQVNRCCRISCGSVACFVR